MKNNGLKWHYLYLSAAVFFALSFTRVAANNPPNRPANDPAQQAQATEVWAPEPAIVNSPEQGVPSDAMVLFDGHNTNQWQAANGGSPKWKLDKGALVVVPQAGDIKTRASFCDVQLHLEWQMPVNINDSNGQPLEGQARNNSGIFLQDQYEIQILDSYHNRTYANGQAGSVYKQSIPLVNASRAPGEWQSYDIIFTAPQFSSEKKLLKPAYVTLLHNGVLVQNHREIEGATLWLGKPAYSAHGCAPLRLQEHGDPVSYRNIWVRKL